MRGEKSFARADFLHVRAAGNAVNSLEVILRDFPDAVDLSARPGPFERLLSDSEAVGRVGPVRTAGDEAARAAPGSGPLPVPDQSQDLIVSLMSLHWANDLPGALSQIRRALRPDGLFLGALLGAGTLKELRAVLTQAELEIRGGAQARVSPFADGFDGAALLQRAGFALPVADAEALPYADGEFDVAMSCVGLMFAPFHEPVADELVRVVRPGGRVGIIAWTPEGFIGQLFATTKPFVPAPPAGAQPPMLWGTEEHVRSLLGDRVELAFTREKVEVQRFATGAEFRDFFKANYGPTIVAYRGIADVPERVAELDAALEELGDRYLERGETGWEYLLTTGTVR